jgi:fermentation-respiration switch protein FrsA (DUF1100 family)
VSTAKILLLIALIPAFAYGGLVGLIYFSQRAILYPGANAGLMPPGLPGRAGWGEAVSIETPDGETLQALYSKPEAGTPSVLFFLGNADRVGNYGFLAQALAARGFGLLAVSYRGYARSTGSPSEDGLLTDGLAAFDWLAARSDGGIVLLGQSLGSGVAVNAAAERPVAGVILVSAFESMVAVARSHYPYLPVGSLLKDTFRSDRRIGHVSAPKLFIHGRRDNIIPLASAEALYRLAPESKQMLIYDAYGHNDLWDEGMVGDVVRFVELVDRPRE